MLLACVEELTIHAQAHFDPHATSVPPRPPHSLVELGSLVSSALDGKRLLAVLAWLLLWSRANRAAAKLGRAAA
jgi:hypothetical protein